MLSVKEFIVAVLLGVACISTARADPERTGSMTAAQQECLVWALFSGRVVDVRQVGVPEAHIHYVSFHLFELGEPNAAKLRAIYAAAYASTDRSTVQQWTMAECLQGWASLKQPKAPEPKPEAAPPESHSQAPVGFVAVKGQPMWCDFLGYSAEQMARSLDVGWRPENHYNEQDLALAQYVVACRDGGARTGESLRDCVVRHCMGRPT